MQSPCCDGKQMSDWQDKGHGVKSALLAKAVSSPALMLPLLTLPGSPGTGTALPLAARHHFCISYGSSWNLPNGYLKG